MAWKTIVISRPARLNVSNDQLIIAQDNTIGFPIEDISVLLIESPEVLLTSFLLNRLAEHGVALLVCDRKHLPSMAGLPFAGHSRLAGVQRTQLEATAPFRKRCWQALVKRKIANQAECLRLIGRPKSAVVAGLAARVSSGDAENLESVAAREHFEAAFGDGFSRGDEDGTNSALNYGYAILRASVARGLVMHGFLPAHGIHHHSELNQFNLADDFVEPFRPVVDLCVSDMRPQGELTKQHREKLVSLLYAEVLIDGKRQPACHAAELMAGSFLAACRDNDPGLLRLPELLPIKTHSYE